MVKQGPTAPTLASTDFGETKIPEPIIVPTIIQIPLMRPTLNKMRHFGKVISNNSVITFWYNTVIAIVITDFFFSFQHIAFAK